MLWNRIRYVLDPAGDGDLREIVPRIARSALNPSSARVMATKLYRRYRDQRGQLTDEQNLDWIKSNLRDLPSLARQIDGELWKESEDFDYRLSVRAGKTLAGHPLVHCGGGLHPFLYFLTRLLAPGFIVETGVAAGYSSQAFLEGIRQNGKGRLFSTDFPLFRDPDPVNSIGILVDPDLRQFWELHTEGDEVGLPAIASKIPQVDIFHYDSDKTYADRVFAFSVVRPLLHSGSIVISDDVQDNSWFHDYVMAERPSNFATFEFGGKYIGFAGTLKPNPDKLNPDKPNPDNASR